MKKKILFINSVCNGSTGKICRDLYGLAEKNGYECCIAYGRGKAPEGYKTIKIGNSLNVYCHVLKTRLLDAHGLASKDATKNLINRIDDFKPNIIHLHNIHGYYLNYEMLFNYLKKHKEIEIVWTLHDCWAFTGHCAYYTDANCYKWIDRCHNCCQKSSYPKSIIDKCNNNWIKKYNAFTKDININVVSVSSWLESQVKQSFLKSHNLYTIKNGVNKEVFTYRASDKFANDKKAGKIIILGVANVWDHRKGLDDFVELSKRLDKNKYKVVVVGVTKKQRKLLPPQVYGILKTDKIEELVEIYSAADIYINFSREETFGMTNYEAQACGTLTISYNNGGSPETIVTKNSRIIGNSVDCALEFIENYDFSKEDREDASLVNSSEKTYLEYIDLYERVLL